MTVSIDSMSREKPSSLNNNIMDAERFYLVKKKNLRLIIRPVGVDSKKCKVLLRMDESNLMWNNLAALIYMSTRNMFDTFNKIH